MASGLRFFFYADECDLRTVLTAIHSAHPFLYTDRKWQRTPVLKNYVNPVEIPSLGKVGPQARCPSIGFLVTDIEEVLVPEVLKLKGGEEQFSAGRFNANSVRISLGGDAGNSTLVCSLVDTLGLTPRAREIHIVFAKEIRLHGKKIGRYVVLPGAADKLEHGWRLTEGVPLLSELDFTVELYRRAVTK